MNISDPGLIVLYPFQVGYYQGLLSLYYEKYLAANFAVPVYRQEGSQCAQDPLCIYDARDEQDLYPPVYHCTDHYADQVIEIMC